MGHGAEERAAVKAELVDVRERKAKLDRASRDLVGACLTGTNADIMKACPAFMVATMREGLLKLDRMRAFDDVSRARAELCLATMVGEADEIDAHAYRLVHALQDRDDQNGEKA